MRPLQHNHHPHPQKSGENYLHFPRPAITSGSMHMHQRNEETRIENDRHNGCPHPDKIYQQYNVVLGRQSSTMTKRWLHTIANTPFFDTTMIFAYHIVFHTNLEGHNFFIISTYKNSFGIQHSFSYNTVLSCVSCYAV